MTINAMRYRDEDSKHVYLVRGRNDEWFREYTTKIVMDGTIETMNAAAEGLTDVRVWQNKEFSEHSSGIAADVTVTKAENAGDDVSGMNALWLALMMNEIYEAQQEKSNNDN